MITGNIRAVLKKIICLFMSYLCYGIHITVLIENEELMRIESKFLDYRIIQDVPDKVHQTFTDFCKLQMLWMSQIPLHLIHVVKNSALCC